MSKPKRKIEKKQQRVKPILILYELWLCYPHCNQTSGTVIPQNIRSMTMNPSLFRVALIGSSLALAISASAFAASDTTSKTEPTDYYKPSLSYATQPETDPPRYVRTLSKTGYDMFKDLYWLEAGAQIRYRYEHRDNDFRRAGVTVDDPSLLRTRAYLGVKEIADPFRAVVEFQDSRRYNSQFAKDDRDWNPYEFIQAYGELYFKEGIAEKTLSIRAGRMSFEELDRRLIGNNEWRNTTNTFQGIRTQIGKKEDAYSFDVFVLQPLVRDFNAIDDVNKRIVFYGAIGHIRKYSDLITLQPFYLGLSQNGGPGVLSRTIQSPGLRGFGVFGKSGFDFDASIVPQFGNQGGKNHKALGTTTEIGYRFENEWKPRLSVNYGYGSGDKSPSDGANNRFERFYGFSRPWSSNDYFQWENLHAPKLRLEIQPNKDLRIDTGYNGYWLASDTDRWNVAGLRDTTGKSGSFIGHEFDIRARYKVAPLVDVNVGYAHFETGEFTRKTSGRSDASEFLYLELTFSLFE